MKEKWTKVHDHKIKRTKVYGNIELTCFAIPKSASLTTPDASTSKFAPLISLQRMCKFFFSSKYYILRVVLEILTVISTLWYQLKWLWVLTFLLIDVVLNIYSWYFDIWISLMPLKFWNRPNSVYQIWRQFLISWEDFENGHLSWKEG